LELPDPPPSWHLKSLIELASSSWSCQLWSPDAYVYGYGTTCRYAFLDAIQRIENGEAFDRLSGMSHPSDSSVAAELAELLQIKPKSFACTSNRRPLNR
jgi:hypothetical protein